MAAFVGLRVTKILRFRVWFAGTATALMAMNTVVIETRAQIMRGNTLGRGSSVMTIDALMQGDFADLIEGGATRGGNLFHKPGGSGFRGTQPPAIDLLACPNGQHILFYAGPAKLLPGSGIAGHSTIVHRRPRSQWRQGATITIP